MTSTVSLSQHVVCQLCFKPFNDPRMLPCLHCFCRHCLHQEMEKVGPEQHAQCPTCQRGYPVPPEGVESLPQDLHLGHEADTAVHMSKFSCGSGRVPCTFCASGCGDPAVVFCATCCRFACAFGRDSHERVPQLLHHTVVSLDQESAARLPVFMRPPDRRCLHQKHGNNLLEWYCTTCSSITCRECGEAFHNNHILGMLTTAAQDLREEIQRALDCVQEQEPALSRAISCYEEAVQQEETCLQEAEMTVKNAFKGLAKSLQEREKALLLDLKNASDCKKTSLNDQIRYIEKKKKRISHCIAITSNVLKTYTDYEVVVLGRLIPDELKDMQKKMDSALITPSQRSRLYLKLNTGQLITAISEFGTFAYLNPSAKESTFKILSQPRVQTKFHIEVKTNVLLAEAKRYMWGGLDIQANLVSKSNDEHCDMGEVRDHGDGMYIISFTPSEVGPHLLHIMMDGQHINGIPHIVEVKSGYDMLQNLQQEIGISESPVCVAIHNNGDIYVGCSDDRIYVFNPDGHLKCTIGEKGINSGQFDGPSMAIKGDIMYVADFNNHRIQILTIEGKALKVFGERGSADGQLDGPYSIVVDSMDRVIVSDSGNNRIQVFSPDGKWLLTIDSDGCGEDAFEAPSGLALDREGNIHVAAFGSNAVKVFTSEGKYVRTYGDLKGPIGVAIDDNDYSFVVSEDLTIYDPEGHKVHTMGNLSEPNGVAIYLNKLYIANNGKNNILTYAL